MSNPVTDELLREGYRQTMITPETTEKLLSLENLYFLLTEIKEIQAKQLEIMQQIIQKPIASDFTVKPLKPLSKEERDAVLKALNSRNFANQHTKH